MTASFDMGDEANAVDVQNAKVPVCVCVCIFLLVSLIAPVCVTLVAICMQWLLSR